MLMAAVTSTALGIDTTSTRPSAAGHTERAGISFVESLAENAVSPSEKLFASVAEPKQGTAVESLVSTSGEAASATRPARGVTQKIKETIAATKPLRSVGTSTGSVSNKLTTTLASAAPRCGAIQSKAHVAFQIKKSDSKPDVVASGSQGRQGQTVVDGVSDPGAIGGTDGADVVDLQNTASAAPFATNGMVKQALPGKTVVPISEELNKASTATVVKDHGTSLKTEKSTKADVKQDKQAKKDKTDLDVSADGIGAQTAVLSQMVVNPAGGQQSVTGDAEPNALSAVSDIASRKNIGMTVPANGKNNKASASAAKSDGSTEKASASSLAENPLSQRTPTDATKPDLAATVNADADKPKSESAVPRVTDSGQLHPASPASGSAPAVVSSNGPTHVAAVGLHTTESISHGVATAQAGPNFVDTSGSVEVAHHTLAATPTSLEVGVPDGAHGWLKIRAELADGGSVNTSLSPSSLAGQEMLHRELPSLATFLKSEHVAVSAVVVQPMPASGFDSRGGFPGSGGGERGLAQQSGGQGREGRQNLQNPTSTQAGINGSYGGLGAVREDEVFSSISYVQGGGWLSVRA